MTSGAGGINGVYRDADFIHAIWHGVGSNGKALFIMPSAEYYYLSDADLGALIAYLKTIPAVNSALPRCPDPVLDR
ncbi:MAG: hypothetical protein GY796_14760 [Chloroflexi bacterium]|nr:hypothetical protein [Chloroflexota bacterium]